MIVDFMPHDTTRVLLKIEMLHMDNKTLRLLVRQVQDRSGNFVWFIFLFALAVCSIVPTAGALVHGRKQIKTLITCE